MRRLPPLPPPAFLALTAFPSLALAADRCRHPLDGATCLASYGALAGFYAVLPALAGLAAVLLAGLVGRRPLARIGAGLLGAPLVAELAALLTIVAVEALRAPGRTMEESSALFRRHSFLTVGVAAAAVAVFVAGWWRWSRRRPAAAPGADQSRPL